MSVSKMNAASQVLKEVDVNKNIKKIISLIEAQYKTHTFKLELYSNLPTALLDEDKFQQIMTNLVDNAAKYSESGKTVTVTTEVIENKICIRVEDEGVGIKPEDYSKLFKKFSRLENHLTSKTQGNGLGLYITKQLVENMNGEISFESSKQGTTFNVLFPFYNQEDALKCSQLS